MIFCPSSSVHTSGHLLNPCVVRPLPAAMLCTPPTHHPHAASPRHPATQMRRNQFVQSDPELKEMLLDAFERRCLSHAQQPVYNMAPMPRSSCVGWGSAHLAW